MNRANFFDHLEPAAGRAAFLSWLLSGGSDSAQGHPTHGCARAFLDLLVQGACPSGEVTVRRDVDHMELVAEVHADGELAQVIVVVGSVTSATKVRMRAQPGRGKKFVRRHLTLEDHSHALAGLYPNVPVAKVYLQLDDEFRPRLSEGWTMLGRSHVLDVVAPFLEGGNDILLDYVAVVRRAEAASTAWRTESLDAWTAEAWKGFFGALVLPLDGSWKHEVSPHGGEFVLRFGWKDGIAPSVHVIQGESGWDAPKAVLTVRVDKKKSPADRKAVEAFLMEEGRGFTAPTGSVGGRSQRMGDLVCDFRATGESGAVDLDGTAHFLKQLMADLHGLVDELEAAREAAREAAEAAKLAAAEREEELDEEDEGEE